MHPYADVNLKEAYNELENIMPSHKSSLWNTSQSRIGLTNQNF